MQHEGLCFSSINQATQAAKEKAKQQKTDKMKQATAAADEKAKKAKEAAAELAVRTVRVGRV